MAKASISAHLPFKTYDAFNRLKTETDGSGVTKTHSYGHARGLLPGTAYSDGTTARSRQYNHLGQLTQVTDDAGTRTLGYNACGELAADSLSADGVTHAVSESFDSFGRLVGYAYGKGGAVSETSKSIDKAGFGSFLLPRRGSPRLFCTTDAICELW